MTIQRKQLSFILITIFYLIGSGVQSDSTYAADSVCAEVKIEIRQEVSFERQAFDAHMQVRNGLTTLSLENINVNVLFTDEAGAPVRGSSDPDDPDALFFIRIDSMEGVDDVTGSGVVAPASTADIHWLIIPAPASVETSPTGKLYFVGARLSYAFGGEDHEIEVTPDFITVKPLPSLQFDYFLPDEVYGDDPFTPEKEPSIPFSLGIRIFNDGHGTANNFKIDSAQPKIVENDQGLLVDFLIEGSEVNGEVTQDSLLLELGDIGPDESTLGRWLMTASLSGRFVEFDARYSHANDLGGQLTSLLDSVETHFLVQDVLVDLPGRDTIRDFLGRDEDVYKVYESDAGVSEVADLSSGASLELVENRGDTAIYRLQMPPTSGFFYCRFDDPQNGTKLISEISRADGKDITPENGWLSKKRVDDSWFHYANVFDYNGGGSYTLTFIDPSLAPTAPEFEDQSDPVHKEGESLTFLVELQGEEGSQPQMMMSSFAVEPATFGASVANELEGNTTISVDRLPVGAELIDLGNGTALLKWTPEAGQAGDYPLTFTASDGEMSTTVRYHLIITDQNNTPTAKFTSSLTIGPVPHEVSFTDESLSIDGIFSWFWDFGDGVISLEQHPSHSYEEPGDYSVSLMITEIDGDQHSYTLPEPVIVESDGNYPKIETGKILATEQWQTIEVSRRFDDPVIVASITGATEQEPANVRIKEINGSEFQVRLEEGFSSDGIHEEEEVSYLVMERGSYELNDGSKITADYQQSSADGKEQQYLFTELFTVTPIVVASVTSTYEAEPAAIVFKEIKKEKIVYYLQPEEVVEEMHGSERVDFIAWEPSSGLMGRALFEVDLLDDVNDQWSEYAFTEPLYSSPVLIAGRQTLDEKDPATVLNRNVTDSSFEVRLAEDTSKDAETSHSKEKVGFIAVSTLTLDLDSDGDTISNLDELRIYGTDPGKKDSDGDHLDDKSELDYWGDSWSEDIDGDGVVNLLDSDSDGDEFSDGLEKQYDFDPADPSDFPQSPFMETGTVMADHLWQRVTLSTTYLDPVVVATVSASIDQDPASVRIRNINGNGFNLRLEEGLYTNDDHASEEVSFLVMERARYTLQDGTVLEAFTVESSQEGKMVKYKFTTPFGQTPIIVSSLASVNEPEPAVVVLKEIKKEGFEYALQQEEAEDATHGTERVDFIAWEPSLGMIDDTVFEVDYLKDVTDKWSQYSFSGQLYPSPILVGGRQTMNEKDPATVLFRNITGADLEVRIAEETSKDIETKHDKEKVGFIAIVNLTAETDSDGDGISNLDELRLYGTNPGKKDSDNDHLADKAELDFWGASWSLDLDGDGVINLLDHDSDGDGFSDGLEEHYGFDPVNPLDFPLAPIMESATVMANNNWLSVTFSDSYLDPVVVGTITGSVDLEPASVRIRNISSIGFELRLEEGLYTDGEHALEEVSFLVMERARYTLADGTLVEAFSLDSSAEGKASKYRFTEPFTYTPVVVTSLTSVNDAEPATVVLKDIKKEGFEYSLKPEEVVEVLHGAERVDFIAWEPSSGLFWDTLFEVNFLENADDLWGEYEFSEPFPSSPIVAVGRQTNNEKDPATVLCRDVTQTSLEVRVAEDTSKDSETSHAKEKLGFIAVGRVNE